MPQMDSKRLDVVVRWALVALAAASLAGVYTRLPLYSLALQAAVFGLAAACLLARRRPWNRNRPLGWAALTLAAMLGISTVFSLDRATSLEALSQWLAYGIVGWLAASAFRPAHGRLMAQYLLLLGVLMAGMAVYFYWGEMGNVSLPVMNSILGNKNHFGGYILLLLPLALALYLEAPAGRDQVAYGAVAVFLGSTFILTYSRGAWFASVPALALLVWVFRKKPADLLGRLALVGAGSVLVAFLIGHSALGQTLDLGYQGALSVARAAAGGEAQGTLAPRLDYWQGALRITADHPATGSGLGTYGEVFPSYQRDPLFYSRFAHNLFLQMGAEAGVPALLALLALFGLLATGWAAPFTSRSAMGRESPAVPVGLAAGLVASTLHNTVELDWYIPAIGLLFALEAGLYLAVGGPLEIRRRIDHVVLTNNRSGGRPCPPGEAGGPDSDSMSRQSPSAALGQPQRPFWRWIGLAAGVLLFAWAAWQWSGQLLLSQAEAAQDPAQAEAILHTAASLNPLNGDPHFRLAELHLNRAEVTGSPADLENGATEAQEALARSPARDDYRVLLARFYLSAGRLEQAGEQLKSLTDRLQPLQAPDAYRQLGETYLRQQRSQEAKAIYQRILAGFPQGPDTPQPPQPGALSRQEAAGLLAEAHLALGNIYTGELQSQKAREEYVASLALKPDSAPANFNLGLIEYNQQRWAEALSLFQQAAGLDPKHAPALYFRGLAHLKLGQREEAAADFRAALAVEPGYEAARREMEKN